jgi:hypothetical protein
VVPDKTFDELYDHKADVGFFDGIYLAGDDWASIVTLTPVLRGSRRN